MRAILQGLAGIGFGAVLLWLALRDTEIEEVRHLIAQTQVNWVLAALACYAVDITLRIWRWHLLLKRLVSLPWYGAGEILVVGYAVNNILPARLGEIFRADYAKRRCGLTRSAVLGTIVIERLCDGVVVVLCLASGLVLLGAPVANSDLWTLWLVAFIAGAGLCVIAAMLLAVVRFRTALAWMPAFLVRRLDSLTDGVTTFGTRTVAPVVLLSLVIWLIETLAIWLVVRAVGLEMDAVQSL